ncbi:MAG: formylglycine-generating enzyme family protein [Desulfobacteraceae bacterium]|nr:formylglycine-generating enzyme family protein [Desulfobacteraceae bacterium]
MKINFGQKIRKTMNRTSKNKVSVHLPGTIIADLAWAADQLSVPFDDMMKIKGRERVQREGRGFLEGEMLDSGIVEKFGTGQLRFWHLNFQEHYAAEALIDRSDDDWWQIIEPKLCESQWAEVIDHLAGCLAWTGQYRLNLLVEKVLNTGKQNDLPSIARSVGVLGRILKILKVYDYEPPERLGWQEARDRVMDIFKLQGAARVPVEQRIKAAEALGQAGDPRIKPLDPEMLPIPGMSDLFLGKYPVTVGEYMRFVENNGYENREYWKEGMVEKEKNNWTEPEGWDEQSEHLNRPVTGVSWYEATAFCNWLSDQTGRSYGLPESEVWFKAADNSDGDYPWGKDEPGPELLNNGRNVGKPTPVGIYPAGEAPGGQLDMAGNVWEWNQDLYEKEGVGRVLRGGSWDDFAGDCRSAFRNYFRPNVRFSVVGFRLSRSVSLGA